MLKRSKPNTPGQRHVVQRKRKEGIQTVPASLRKGKQSIHGRNQTGRITVRHRGGCVKRRTRQRVNPSQESGYGIVIGIQYDPNRTARIALRKKRNLETHSLTETFSTGSRRPNVKTCYQDQYKYVLAVEGLKVGQRIQYGVTTKANQRERKNPLGSTFQRKDRIVGTQVCNLERRKGKGGQYRRAAGAYAEIMRKDPQTSTVWIRMKNGKIWKFDGDCTATVGSVSGEEHRMEKIGKAGRNRLKGKRPTVRGEAMNPVDHPHGGRTRGGRVELTPWARRAKGKPTKKRIKNRWRVRDA